VDEQIYRHRIPFGEMANDSETPFLVLWHLEDLIRTTTGNTNVRGATLRYARCDHGPAADVPDPVRESSPVWAATNFAIRTGACHQRAMIDLRTVTKDNK
jgi:hypothetical protein